MNRQTLCRIYAVVIVILLTVLIVDVFSGRIENDIILHIAVYAIVNTSFILFLLKRTDLRGN